MQRYHFALTLAGVTSETPELEDSLFASGRDDGLICFYGKSVYVEFDRESENFANEESWTAVRPHCYREHTVAEVWLLPGNASDKRGDLPLSPQTL